jgi:hypothetical protein
LTLPVKKMRSTRESDEALNFTGVWLLGFWGSVLG